MTASKLAHVRQNESGQWDVHGLEDHLHAVGKLAGEFAGAFGNEDWAYLAGVWHDLGKYSKDFQRYIKGASGYNPADAHLENLKGRVDHSTAGAIHAVRSFPAGTILAYLIAGHHSGLGDWENADSGRAQVSQRILQSELLEGVLAEQPPSDILDQPAPQSRPPQGCSPALWIRFLFSCLVDADFLDTEAFMNSDQASQRSQYPALTSMASDLDRYLQNLSTTAAKSPVNDTRDLVLKWCLGASEEQPGIFSLTVPTGGGKTLSSMAFAMRHAVKYSKRRIVYVIPYTSIIEQTANIFRSIFGECVIEHQSNSEPELETVQSRLACENWDAPIIVTTNVQFFESLFANRTSRVRKLHRLTNAVVILDEAQSIAPEFLKPIVNALQELSKGFGTTILLSTATQPALSDTDSKDLFKGLENVTEIIPDPEALAKTLKRVTLIMPKDLHERMQPEQLAQRLSQHEKVLCIVNRRDECRELYAAMPPGTIHLSGYMCGEHKSVVIQKIKRMLKNDSPLRVVSTQLVEAGVDIDFPVVYRAFSGLDSIAQAGGRCNREGLLDNGDLFIFGSWKSTPRGTLRQAEAACREVLRSAPTDLLSPEIFKQYFRHLYWIKGKDLDKHNILADLKPTDQTPAIKFREAALKFKLIDEASQRSIFVRYGRGGELIDLLQRSGPDRWLLRKLQRFTVSIPVYLFEQLTKNGDVIEIREGYFAQAYESLYHLETGFLGDRTDLVDPDAFII